MKVFDEHSAARWPSGVAVTVALIGCLLQPASAKEDAVRAPAKQSRAVTFYDWTGFYVGFNAGVGSSQTRGFDPRALGPNQVEENGRGIAAGAQAGFNWQIAPHWVMGVEGDIGYLGVDSITNLSFEYASGIKTGAYGTLRGRFGYAAGPSLIYITGGAAFVKVTEQWNFLGNVFVPFPPESHTASKVARGWTIGTGIEAMVGANLSARAEYLFIDAGKGTQQVIHAGTPEPVAMQTYHNFHVFRFGLNYMFGAPSPPATFAMADWSGAYLGVNAGVGMSLAVGSQELQPDVMRSNGAGFTGGLQGGYNWQIAERFVLGLEADINGLGIDHAYMKTPTGQSSLRVEHNWYGTLRGRIGYAVGPALIYATGGFAVAQVKNTYDFSSTPLVSTAWRVATGSILGGGIETMLNRRWSAKIEYLNVDLGGRAKVQDAGFPIYIDNNFQVFRIGLNYRWSANTVGMQGE